MVEPVWSCPGFVKGQPEPFPVTLPASPAAVLPASSETLLLRLVLIDPGDCGATVVARSYGAHPWEGVTPKPAELDCDGERCVIDTAGHAPGTFRVDAVQEDPNRGNEPEIDAARLLAQATFGATPGQPAGLRLPGAAAAWMAQQLASEPTLLRAHYRARTNPRIGGFGAETNSLPYAGAVVGPCELGARWHRHAFDHRDVGKVIQLVVTPAPAPARAVLFTQFGLGYDWTISSDTAGTAGSTAAEDYWPTLRVNVGDTVTFVGTPGPGHWFELVGPDGASVGFCRGRRSVQLYVGCGSSGVLCIPLPAARCLWHVGGIDRGGRQSRPGRTGARALCSLRRLCSPGRHAALWAVYQWHRPGFSVAAARVYNLRARRVYRGQHGNCPGEPSASVREAQQIYHCEPGD